MRRRLVGRRRTTVTCILARPADPLAAAIVDHPRHRHSEWEQRRPPHSRLDGRRGSIRSAGCPIASPRANRSTGISPTQAWHVRNDLDGRIDLILDSGRTRVGIESTVLYLTSQPLRVLRPGSITREQLSEVLGESVATLDPLPEAPSAYSSPGQMAIHYVPRTPTYRVESRSFARLPEIGRWALISVGDRVRLPEDLRPTWHVHLSSPERAEARLYARSTCWTPEGSNSS